MSITQSSSGSILHTETLLDLIKVIDVAYDDECSEIPGWNLSGVDDIPISILNLTKHKQRAITDLDKEDTTFMWKALLIDCLINMDYKNYENRKELVEILKKKYKNDPKNLFTIDQFHQTYKKSDAIRWYKEESCIYTELNEALRRSCINMLFAYRFFLRDLFDQLQAEKQNFQVENNDPILHLYRGQRISDAEIQRLSALQRGCLISVDSFFSTSRSEDVAYKFMHKETEATVKLNPLRYDVTCDLRLDTKPFADISSESLGKFADEYEVLFMVGTIFQFNGIKYDEQLKCWRVKLKLIDSKSHRLSKLYEKIKEEMGEETNLLTLGALLSNAGDFEHALRIYTRQLLDLIMDHSNLTHQEHEDLIRSLIGYASVQNELGRYDVSLHVFKRAIEYINDYIDIDKRRYYRAEVYYSQSFPLLEKGDYLNALKQCKHALRVFIEDFGYENNQVAGCYEIIGNIYAGLGKVDKTNGNVIGQCQHFQTAYLNYKKALKIRKKIHEKAPDHPHISATYLHIGELFRDLGRSDEALRYTLKAHDSFIKAFPKSHYWIGIALDNIGEIYVLQQRFTEAKEKYNEAIDVYTKTLPTDHRFIGETLHNIGKLYCCCQVFDLALEYFNQAKKIYQRKRAPKFDS